LSSWEFDLLLLRSQPHTAQLLSSVPTRKKRQKIENAVSDFFHAGRTISKMANSQNKRGHDRPNQPSFAHRYFSSLFEIEVAIVGVVTERHGGRGKDFSSFIKNKVPVTTKKNVLFPHGQTHEHIVLFPYRLPKSATGDHCNLIPTSFWSNGKLWANIILSIGQFHFCTESHG
jgi:hypothetical protein